MRLPPGWCLTGIISQSSNVCFTILPAVPLRTRMLKDLPSLTWALDCMPRSDPGAFHPNSVHSLLIVHPKNNILKAYYVPGTVSDTKISERNCAGPHHLVNKWTSQLQMAINCEAEMAG